MGQFIQAFQYQILEETKIENDMNEIDGLEFSIHKESDNDSPNLFFNSNQAALNLGSQTHRPSNSSKPPLLVNKSKNKQKLQKQTSRQRQPSQRNTSNSQTRSDQGIKSNKQNLKQLQQIRSLLVQSNKFSKFEDLYNRGTQSTLRKQKDYDSQTSTTQCTFKPEIDPVSKLLATSHSQFNSSKLSQSVQINDLHSSLYLKGKMLIEEKQKKISDIQKKRNKSIKQECTFQPNSHKYKYLHDRLPNNSIVMTEHKSNMDQFYDKNRLWEDEKQQRLLQERERKRQMEMDECLFQPNIRERENSKSPFTSQRYSSSKTSPMKHNSNLNNQKLNTSVYEDKSIQQFLQRINRAKQEQERKSVIRNSFDGSTWNGQLTEPKAFKITPGQQASLQQNQITQKNLNYNHSSTKRNTQKNQIKNSPNKSVIQLDNNKFNDAISILRNELYSIDLDDNIL